MGRARALEVMLSADDYGAELAERYGWINRALLPGHLVRLPGRLRIASQDSRPQAVPRSGIASMRLLAADNGGELG